MTTYNTQNPVGSADPRDLYDNAQVIDDYANSEADTTTDRLGVERATIAGIDAAARAAIANAGYEFVGDYAAGIELTAYNQVVREAGEFWRVSGSTELPYTTTGAGMPEGGAFVSVGDAALRQELADPAQGGDLVWVSTSTGEQVLPEALDARVLKGSIGEELVYSDTGEQDLSSALNSRKIVLQDNIEVTVGATGDYTTINDALTAVSSSDIRHMVPEVSITIRLLPGFVMEEQVFVVGQDLGHIFIAADDPVVTISRAALTRIMVSDAGGSIPWKPAFCARRATLPVIGCLFDMDETGDPVTASGTDERLGIYITEHSTATIRPDCGIINAAGGGLFVEECSRVQATDTLWDGVKRGSGIYAQSSSMVNALRASCQNINGGGAGEGGAGIYSNQGSFIYARSANVNNASRNGFYCNQSSRLVCRNGQASNCQRGVVSIRSSTTTAMEVTATDNSIHNLYADHSSTIDAQNSVVTGAGDRNVFANNASTISVLSSDCSNSSNVGVEAIRGSTINANGVDATGCTGTAILSSSGSNVECSFADVGSSDTTAVLAFRASNINFQASTSSSGNIRVAGGSFINANSATGSLAQTANQINSNGIIFQ